MDEDNMEGDFDNREGKILLEEALVAAKKTGRKNKQKINNK